MTSICSICTCPLTCLAGESRCLCARCIRAANKIKPEPESKEAQRKVRDHQRYIRERQERLAKARAYYRATKRAQREQAL